MRLFLILLVALGLAPGIWLRSPLPVPDPDPTVRFIPIKLPNRAAGETRVLAAWQLRSGNEHFGSYSALIALDADTLLAGSDRGRTMRFVLPGNGGGRPETALAYLGNGAALAKHLTDVESLTRNPDTGDIWIGYEGRNAIERRNADLRAPERVTPAAMRNWSANSGPEAMVRLADGRFIVMSEDRPSWGETGFATLLFPGDPVDGAVPEEARFIAPAGYRPVDMAQIPDGRVLVMVRKVAWRLPPQFPVKILVADPRAIVAGEAWHGREIAAIAAPLPSDNYEGLAVLPRDDGALDLWIISDDNMASFQRTLLLKMRWDPRGNTRAPGAGEPKAKEKARRPAARPSNSGKQAIARRHSQD